jgi:hypothetical protein
MSDLDYWKECIAQSAEDCDLSLTDIQLEILANGASSAHEMYSQAYYDPGWDDRLSEIEREYKKKEKDHQQQFDKYIRNAETAVKRILSIHPDDNISIGDYGEIERLR